MTYAYRASYERDEGRYVVANLFVPEEPDSPRSTELEATPISKLAESYALLSTLERKHRWERRNVHRFTTPKTLDDRKVVGRLAQTLHTDDSALVVEEMNGKLHITGICLLNQDDSEHHLMRMPDRWGHEGLRIQLLGPGDFVVAEAGAEYTFRANEIFVHQPICDPEPTKEWLIELSHALVNKAKTSVDWDDTHIDVWTVNHGIPVIDLSLLWSRIIRVAVQLRHGGAFVIVPDVTQAPIERTFTTEPLDLGMELINACSLSVG
jgi:hypothetical protein